MPSPYESDPIISLRDVKKAFGPKVIYDNCTLDIYPGETITIIGGSGTGKSVTLKMLIGLLHADAGSISVFGTEVVGLKEAGLLPIRRRVAMLFQGAALFDSLTVAQNIKYPLREHHWGNEKKLDERVEEVLEMVGLPGSQKLKPAELSGGMRKRVGLARAIAVEPDVILYDEPTTGLDPINVVLVKDFIFDLGDYFKPGEFEFRVKVTDTISGKTILLASPLTMVGPVPSAAPAAAAPGSKKK